MKKSLIALASMAVMGAATAAPIVPNGSFEDYDVPENGMQFLGFMQGSWPFSGAWSANGTYTVIVDDHSGGLPAGNGSQYAFMSNSHNAIYQGFDGFTAGQKYQVSYWAYGSGFWEIEGIDQETVASGSIIAGGAFHKYSFEFTANNGNQHIWFTGGNGTGLGLDNITIAAVPEPETYAMMLAGLGMVGFMARRKKSS